MFIPITTVIELGLNAYPWMLTLTVLCAEARGTKADANAAAHRAATRKAAK